ncbi:MAG: hypothetical protein JO235_17245 [Chroococcidiopsidaceae cyanobacterium CP_BM_RX_35]|nr:hypothetical protein [Chroococcidiopsidaceae cyanobacterium CP_BM_RX_35]
MILDRLKRFRQSAYTLLGKGKDAIFDLMDAVLTSPRVNSFMELSLSPVFRRAWSSLYAGLRHSRPPKGKLIKLYIEQMPTQTRPLLAGDHTGWSRPEAFTLKDRTIEHQATPIAGNKPITVGQGFSTIAWIPEAQGSWALPLKHERITSFETPLSRATFQLKQVCQQLSVRPIAVFDSEYGNAAFVKQTADLKVDLLLRLRSNLCLWGAPPPYAGKGRPKLHGAKFKLAAASTWGTPTAILELEDPKWGTVQIQHWTGLHFRAAAVHRVQLLRITVTGKPPHRRSPKPMWLVWLGEEMPSLEQVWRSYLRRFAVDHWNRFAKQRLHTTIPQFSTTQMSERWSELMPLLSWQLWLARASIIDNPLPWQKLQTNLTPGRVAQGFPTLLAAIGTPASAPKPRGKSPGWPLGQPRPKRTRYPIVKKTTPKPKKSVEKQTQKPA